MDIDLQPGWEKKALIILGVIVVIIIVYAFNPFNHPNVVTDNNTTDISPAPTPSQPPANPNNTTNFTKNLTNASGNFTISADQAKRIVAQANPGFNTGEPTQGSVTINNVTTSVWIVPLVNGTIVTKNIYVDASTGNIVGTAVSRQP